MNFATLVFQGGSSPSPVVSSAWTFGWTQLLTLIGFGITVAIAVGGFRTFGRWKREKIEERRIDLAVSVLALAYESDFVFGRIRQGLAYSSEYEKLERKDGESEDEWSERGSYWVVGRRIFEQKEFFDRAWRLQPEMMAVYGEQVAELFMHLHNARATVQAASQTLAWELPIKPAQRSQEDFELRLQLRNDLWGAPEGKPDRVKDDLDAFRQGIIRLCRPVVDKEFKV